VRQLIGFFCHTRQLLVNLTVRDESLDDHTDDFICCVRVNVEAPTVPPISKYKILAWETNIYHKHGI
jgi:hypothetical protein